MLFHTEQSLDGQLHFSVEELLVPTCVEQDVQEQCAPMLPRAMIAQCLEDDRRWCLQKLQAHTGIDQATVHKILREDLLMRTIAAKWVPHALTEQQNGVAMKLAVFIWKGIKMERT